MKVTKEMVHPDLQASFGAMNLMSALMKRTWIRNFFDWLGRKGSQGNNIESLDCDELYLPSSDGEYQIRTRIYRPPGNAEKLPVMLYIHGGGYILGFPESFHDVIERFVQTRACVVIAPDYRKAGTKPFPAGLDDCCDALLWAKENAEELGVRAEKFMVAGHSAGGGLTAAVTLKMRDTKAVDIAFQMPIYPMIDDLQPHDPDRYIETAVWDTGLNTIGWNEYLADLHKVNAEIPAYAAPARNTDYQGFPPTITFVGDLEPFYWETVSYVEALRAADIEVSFKEYPGCFHGFDLFGKGVADQAKEFTFDQYADFYDRYVSRSPS